MTRKQRRTRNHERREERRQLAGQWGTAGKWGARCAHCGHAHLLQQDQCLNCQCRDFDF